MKKTILILAGVLWLSTAAVQAQDVTQDTTRQSEQSQNYRKDMVKIQATEIPTSLRTTLQDAQYQGWEKATIYRSKANDMYLVEMKDASGKVNVHRFDASGKAVKDN
jgi:uncharacterized protein YdeI (BOF family)